MSRQYVHAHGAGVSVGIGPIQSGLRTQRTIHVLSVGSINRGSMVHDALLEGPEFQLSIAPDMNGLRLVLDHEDFELAILHNTLAGRELRDACRFIRRQWPKAKILVIRAGQDFLEDALYDERVVPDVAREGFLATIGLLIATWREGRPGNASS
jgi:hypothetical protein